MNRKRCLPALVCLLVTACLLTLATLTMSACGKSSKSGTAKNEITKSSLAGTYHSQKAGEQLLLRADGTYRLKQDTEDTLAGTFSGPWTLSGRTITLKIQGKNHPGTVLSNGKLKDDVGDIWTKQ